MKKFKIGLLLFFLATFLTNACFDGEEDKVFPPGISYPDSFVVYTMNRSISPNTPDVTGEVAAWSVAPDLPDGLILNTDGSITGTPLAIQDYTLYTITAGNEAGSVQFEIRIAVIQYYDNGDGTISDTKNNWKWAKCIQGLTYDSETNECTGTAGTYQYCNEQDNDCNGGSDTGDLTTPVNNGNSEAYDTCNNSTLAYISAWQVPTKAQLDELKAFESVHFDTFFPTLAGGYWSSTSVDVGGAYYLVFKSGNSVNYNKDNRYYVRCLSP